MNRENFKGYHLSPLQEHTWLIQQAGSNQPFRVQIAVMIEGDLNTSIITAAIERVVERHEILRTTFQCFPEMELPAQVITENCIPIIRQYDLSGSELGEQWEKIDELFLETIRMPFDIERGPLLQLYLIMLSPTVHLLLVGLPALCSDLVSLENLIGEIKCTYEACLLGKELSDEPLQYADIAEWQKQLLESEDTDIGREHWIKQDLRQLTGAELYVRRKNVRATDFDRQYIFITSDSDRMTEIVAMIREYETSAQVFYLTCWQILLGRFIGHSNIIVGTAFNGRNYQVLELSLGLFEKYIPISYSLNNSRLFSDMLQEVGKLVQDSYESQEYFAWERFDGIEDIEDRPRYFPLSYEFKEWSDIISSINLTFSIYKRYACIDRYQVKLSCIKRNDSLITEFHYDNTLYRREEIERLAKQYHVLLDSVIAKPAARIGELEILSVAERERLLIEFNNTKVEYPRDKC